MKAYGYLRVSGKAQVDGDGFVRQEQAIRQYAASNGYTIESVFREEGVSGTKAMESRPALLELMEKLDRLARDLMVSESILADFQRKGVTVVSVAEPDLCSSEPTRILMRQMMSAFAQYEKSMIVAKLRGARQRTKAKTGRCEGVKPYGASADEQTVLGRICALHAQGRTLVAISEVLNAEGVMPRRGAKWYPSSVRNVILREGAAA
jgi:DNA invertase Pin-like site-specific DNA recombinase